MIRIKLAKICAVNRVKGHMDTHFRYMQTTKKEGGEVPPLDFDSTDFLKASP